MQQSPSDPATPFLERLRTEGGRRALAISLALLLEALLLLLLFSLGSAERPGNGEEDVVVVNLKASEPSADTPEPSRPEPGTAEREQPVTPRTTPERPRAEEPRPLLPAEPIASPAPRAVIPTPFRLPPSSDRGAARPAPAPGPAYGPPDTGGSSAGDTERVGTAPNGQPLYAAAWYREPHDDELRGYLSTASGPGWGLIACRTAPDFRVEDCVGLEEYPRGSQITRAILAAAWQFRVRPPRLGGQPQVGSWVRIRIDYGIERR